MRNQLTRRQNLWDLVFDDMDRLNYGRDIDIYYEDNKFVVEADIPGFDKEDITIDFKGDVLSISAERNEEVEDTSNKNYYYRSRKSQKFNRQIRFNEVDANEVAASYDNGVLKVILPTKQKEEDIVSRIEVK